MMMNLLIDDTKAWTKLPKIMRASIHLFVQKGIHGTTIKDIAKEAGVAEGALYRHFKSKEELAWTLFSTHLNQFTAHLMAAVLKHPRAQDRTRVFVEESFAAYESDPELFSYLILREHSELDKYAKTYMHPGHVITQIIEDGQKNGEIRAGDPLLWGGLFVGAVIRLCVLRMYGNMKEDLVPLAGEVSQAIWRMLALE